MSPGAPQPSAAYRSIYYDIESYISLESYESGLRFWDYNQKALAGDPYIISLRKIFLTELALEYRRIISKPNGIKNILKEARKYAHSHSGENRLDLVSAMIFGWLGFLLIKEKSNYWSPCILIFL